MCSGDGYISLGRNLRIICPTLLRMLGLINATIIVPYPRGLPGAALSSCWGHGCDGDRVPLFAALTAGNGVVDGNRLVHNICRVILAWGESSGAGIVGGNCFGWNAQSTWLFRGLCMSSVPLGKGLVVTVGRATSPADR